MFSNDDIAYMRSALNIARQGVGQTWPNPSVGCVIVKDGKVVGRARTANAGRPHAEPRALEQAGRTAEGASVYVTLEPCSHQGKTPPCVDALIAAKVGRVVVGAQDPDDRVAGQGIAALKAAGIHVDVGLCEQEVNDIHAGHILRVTQKRPFITLKTATTLDSKVATISGESQWITGKLARQRGHLERYYHDAIMVGAGTFRNDNPSLTCRLPGTDKNMVRIIVGSEIDILDNAEICEDIDNNPVWVFGCANTEFKNKGIRIFDVSKTPDGLCDIQEILGKLADEGITRMLVEGGPALITSFISMNLFDRLLWFRSGSILGSDAQNVLQDLSIKDLQSQIKLQYQSSEVLGPDRLDIYARGN